MINLSDLIVTISQYQQFKVKDYQQLKVKRDKITTWPQIRIMKANVKILMVMRLNYI